MFETGRSRAGLKIEGRAAERVGGMAGTGSGGLDMIQREYSRVLTQRTGSPQSLNGRQTSRRPASTAIIRCSRSGNRRLRNDLAIPAAPGAGGIWRPRTGATLRAAK